MPYDAAIDVGNGELLRENLINVFLSSLFAFCHSNKAWTVESADLHGHTAGLTFVSVTKKEGKGPERGILYTARQFLIIFAMCHRAHLIYI